MASPVLGAEQLARLRDRFQEFSQGSHYRANALTIRSRAHTMIRDLTSPRNQPNLTLDDFDEHVWRLGNIGTRHESFDWRHAEQVLAETPPDRFAKMLDSGNLWFVGNMTWGSAVKTLRAYAHDRSFRELTARMRQAVGLLLHQTGSIESRLRQISDLGIGFGRNISSGLLMAWHPQEYILYNSRSENCWAAFDLGFDPGYNWVKPYLRYNAFCRTILDDHVLDLQNLVDLDIFVYWHTIQYPLPPQKTTPTKRKRRRRSKTTQSDITLEQLKATKQEMSPEKFQTTWGELYDKLVAEELSKLTTDVTVAELGERAKRRVDEIHAFLHGQTANTPTAEVLCDWVQFCYAMELHREANGLLLYVRQGEIDPAIYRRAKRIAKVSRSRLVS